MMPKMRNYGYRNVLMVIFVNILIVQYSFAWKPITGNSGLRTTYSLQQSHPDLGATGQESEEITSSHASSSLSFEAAYPEQDARILAGVPLEESGVALASTPATFKFDNSEDFGYSHASNLFSSNDFAQKRCAVKKFAFNHNGTVEFEHNIPELNQFTICYWTRFTNHSGDHVILTYSDEKYPRAVQFWVANANNSSFVSMAIKGQQIYRLNYPVRLRQWHHTCSSWNGKTGEWQVWMKNERIGRGFHNSLVGHKILANGKLYAGGSSPVCEVSEGLHFEITFVQIYRIALSAGKAHRDHKHHHVHHFGHDGQELPTTTRAPPKINRPLPMNPLLANGQIPTRVRINLANPQAAAQPGTGPQTFDINGSPIAAAPQAPQSAQPTTVYTSFVNGQFHGGSRLLSQQLLGIQSNLNIASQIGQPAGTSSGGKVQFVDETETRIFFKRQASDKNATKTIRSTKNTKSSVNADDSKNLKKRELVLLNDGVIVDNGQHGVSSTLDYTFEGLADFGDKRFKHDLNVKMSLEEEISMHDREPAEEEVRAVMSYCSACDTEPFEGAIVFSWKDVVEKMDNALKGTSVGGCGDF